MEKVFSHSDEHHLRKMHDLSLRVRSAISASGKSMMSIFEEWDEDSSGAIDMHELEAALQELRADADAMEAELQSARANAAHSE